MLARRRRRRRRAALAVALAAACLAPSRAAAEIEYEYQFQLQSTLLYCNHWFSGHDPGPSVGDGDRRRLLLPEVILWRNAPGATLHIESRHTQWDLAYSFGYDWFVVQNVPAAIAPGATTIGPSRWTGSDTSLNSYENRFDAIGRIELGEHRHIVLVQRLLQSSFNNFSVPPLAGTMPVTVKDFNIADLTFLGSTTRVMLEQRFSRRWELRPEIDVEAFKIFGQVPPELGSVLGSRGLFTLQSTLFRHSDHDVLEANAAWQYVAVSTPPDIPNPDPTQPPLSQAAFGRDYMVLHGYVGWAHEFARWLSVHGRIGYAANMFATSQPGDSVYHGVIGGLRIHVHNEWWNVVLEYAREFDTSIWGASVINEDVGVFEVRRRLGEAFIVWTDLTINRRNVREPNSDATLGPAHPLGAPINLPQYITYDTLGLTYRATSQLTFDAMVTYRRQWGPGVALPYWKYIPGIQITYLWPQRTAPPLRMNDAVRRLTREPLDDERRSEREREDRDRRERMQQQQGSPAGDEGGGPRRRRPTNAPGDWQEQPRRDRPEGAPPASPDTPPSAPPDEPPSAR